MKDSAILKYLYILILSSIIIIVISFFESNLEKAPLFDEKVSMFNEGWKYDNGKSKRLSITLPVNLKAPTNTVVKISNILPRKYVPGMSITIITIHETLRVLIDNVDIYEYGFQQKLLFDGGTGSTYHIIPLPEGTEGKEIVLELSSKYGNCSGKIDSITLGSKTASIHNILSNQLIPFIICCLTLLVGVIYISLHLYLNHLFRSGKSLLYLGLFAVLASTWSATETKVLQFIFPYEYIDSLVTYLSLILCPIPILLFIKGTTHSSKSKAINFLCILSILNFVITNTVSLLKISSYHDMLPFNHAIIISTCFLSIYSILKEIKYYKNFSTYILGMSVAILALFASIELYSYYVIKSFETASFFRIGLFLFIILTGISTINKLIETVKAGVNAEAIKNLAYTDILTNVNNRTAYEKDIDEINQNLNAKSNFIAFMFDLNNLKEVNDSFGHSYGDSLIISAAECLTYSFHNFAECYRIGGDEFALIMINKNIGILNTCIKKLNTKILEYNNTNPIKLSIACGYAQYDSTLDKDFNATFNRADARMYENKGTMKTTSMGMSAELIPNKTV